MRCECPVSRTKHRAFNKSGDRTGCIARGDREYQLLRRRSGTLRSLTGQLLHQVGIEPFSQRLVRDLEWIAVKWDGLLSSCQRHVGQRCKEATLDRKRIRRQRGRPGLERPPVLLYAL